MNSWAILRNRRVYIWPPEVANRPFPLANTHRPARRIRPPTKIFVLPRFGFPKAHVGAHVPAVPFCPAAHTPEWSDECPSELCQGILDSDGLRFRHALCDQSRGFETAKSSGEHALRNASKVTAQLPVTIGPLLQREQNLGCPPADEDRRRQFRSLYRIHNVLPPAKTSRRNRGFCLARLFSQAGTVTACQPCAPGAIRNICVPTPKLVPIRLQTRDRTPDSIFQDVGEAQRQTHPRRRAWEATEGSRIPTISWPSLV